LEILEVRKRLKALLAACVLALPLGANAEQPQLTQEQVGAIAAVLAVYNYYDHPDNGPHLFITDGKMKDAARHRRIHNTITGNNGKKVLPDEIRKWARKADTGFERGYFNEMAKAVELPYSKSLEPLETRLEGFNVLVARGHLEAVGSGDDRVRVGDHRIGWDAQNWGEWGKFPELTPTRPSMTFSTRQDDLQRWRGAPGYMEPGLTYKGKAVGSFVRDRDGDGTLDAHGSFRADATLNGKVNGNQLTVSGKIDNFRGRDVNRKWEVWLNEATGSADGTIHNMTGTTLGNGSYSVYAYGDGRTPDFIRGGFNSGVMNGHVAGHFGAER